MGPAVIPIQNCDRARFNSSTAL